MANNTTWPKRDSVFAVLGLLTLNFLLFGDLFLGNSTKVLSSSQADLYLHFAAWRQFGFDELKRGHLTLWNPHYLCGNPFLGGFESALLYPLNWHYLFMPFMTAINLGIVLHVFLAGFFTYLWASYRKLHPLAAFLSGVIFMWGGAYYLHIYAGHLPNLCAMVWAPLIFLAIDGLLDKRKAIWVLLGIFAVSMQILAGHPQYVYFTGIAAFFYVILNLKDHSHRLSFLGGFIVFYGAALLITAAQSWAGIETVFNCARHLSLDRASAGSFSFPPQNLLTLFLPDFFGNLETDHYWSSWYLWEGSLFIGFTSFVLVIAAMVYVKAKDRRWLVTMTMVTLVLAFGAYTPLYSFFYHWVPLFDGMRGIGKFAFLASLFLSLLAGMGFNHWLLYPKSFRKGAWCLVVIGVMLIILGRLIFGSAMSGLEGIWAHYFSSLPWLASSLVSMALTVKGQFVYDAGVQAAWSLVWGGVICLILSGLCFWSATHRKAVYGAAILVVFELFLFVRSNRATFEMPQLQANYDQLSKFYLNDPGDYRVYGTGAMSLVTDGLEIWEDEPMIPSRYAQFICYTQGIPDNRLFSVSPVFSKFSKVFGLVRLKYILSDVAGVFHGTILPFPLMPRMSLIHHWTIQPEMSEQLKTITSDTFEPSREVLLETDPGISTSTETAQDGLRWIDRSTDEVEVEAKTLSPCILLVTDNYFPGWKAEALPDSQQKNYQVMPGDYFLRAVPLRAGYHHFLLHYRPLSFEMGKWVSLLSCFLYVVILLCLWRRNRSLGFKETI